MIEKKDHASESVLGKRKNVDFEKKPRRSKRIKRKPVSILRISSNICEKYVYLAKVEKGAKAMNKHRLMRYQARL